MITNLKNWITVIPPNPIQSNPWMDPIHVQLCSRHGVGHFRDGDTGGKIYHKASERRQRAEREFMERNDWKGLDFDGEGQSRHGVAGHFGGGVGARMNVVSASCVSHVMKHATISAQKCKKSDRPAALASAARDERSPATGKWQRQRILVQKFLTVHSFYWHLLISPFL